MTREERATKQRFARYMCTNKRRAAHTQRRMCRPQMLHRQKSRQIPKRSVRGHPLHQLHPLQNRPPPLPTARTSHHQKPGRPIRHTTIPSTARTHKRQRHTEILHQSNTRQILLKQLCYRRITPTRRSRCPATFSPCTTTSMYAPTSVRATRHHLPGCSSSISLVTTWPSH